jgi:hypothetical protein
MVQNGKFFSPAEGILAPRPASGCSHPINRKMTNTRIIFTISESVAFAELMRFAHRFFHRKKGGLGSRIPRQLTTQGFGFPLQANEVFQRFRRNAN